MPQNVLSHLALHCLLGWTKSSGTKIEYSLKIVTYDPLKYRIGYSNFNATKWMGVSLSQEWGRLLNLSDFVDVVLSANEAY